MDKFIAVFGAAHCRSHMALVEQMPLRRLKYYDSEMHRHLAGHEETDMEQLQKAFATMIVVENPDQAHVLPMVGRVVSYCFEHDKPLYVVIPEGRDEKEAQLLQSTEVFLKLQGVGTIYRTVEEAIEKYARLFD